MSKFGSDQLQEKVEILDGSRSGARRKAAVRIEDLDGLLDLPQIQAKEITAAPTAAQYNTLVRDVKRLGETLSLLSKALRGRL